MQSLRFQPREGHLSARRKFRGFKKEEPKAARRMQVKESETTKRLVKAWSELGSKYPKWDEVYQDALDVLKKNDLLHVSAHEIEKFSIILPSHDQNMPPTKLGTFLSALINESEDERFVVHTTNMRCRALGFRNRKHLTVEGPGGHCIGKQMESGLIEVNGSAHDRAGEEMTGGTIIVNGYASLYAGASMKGGELIINGDCVDEVGYVMEGGKITVNGDAGQEVGQHMRGGEIHLNGTYKWISRLVDGGKIFHKGKLIVDR